MRPRWKTKAIGSDVGLDLTAPSDAASAVESRQDRRLALWGGLILGVLALTDLTVRVVSKESTLAHVKQDLQAQFTQSFGAGAGPGEELDVARFRVAQLDKSLAIIDRSRNNVLASLSDLAKQLPPGIPLTIRELTIEGLSVHLEGETSSFDAVEKIKQAFLSNQVFQGISVTDTRSAPCPTKWFSASPIRCNDHDVDTSRTLAAFGDPRADHCGGRGGHRCCQSAFFWLSIPLLARIDKLERQAVRKAKERGEFRFWLLSMLLKQARVAKLEQRLPPAEGQFSLLAFMEEAAAVRADPRSNRQHAATAAPTTLSRYQETSVDLRLDGVSTSAASCIPGCA